MSDTSDAGAPVETIPMAMGPSLDPMSADANGAIPAVFDVSRRYEVTFAEPVDMPPFRYGPRDGATLMSGGVLNRIRQEKGPDVFRSAVAR